MNNVTGDDLTEVARLGIEVGHFAAQNPSKPIPIYQHITSGKLYVLRGKPNTSEYTIVDHVVHGDIDAVTNKVAGVYATATVSWRAAQSMPRCERRRSAAAMPTKKR